MDQRQQAYEVLNQWGLQQADALQVENTKLRKEVKMIRKLLESEQRWVKYLEEILDETLYGFRFEDEVIDLTQEEE